jgi:hypothetical protein
MVAFLEKHALCVAVERKMRLLDSEQSEGRAVELRPTI